MVEKLKPNEKALERERNVDLFKSKYEEASKSVNVLNPKLQDVTNHPNKGQKKRSYLTR